MGAAPLAPGSSTCSTATGLKPSLHACVSVHACIHTGTHAHAPRGKGTMAWQSLAPLTSKNTSPPKQVQPTHCHRAPATRGGGAPAPGRARGPAPRVAGTAAGKGCGALHGRNVRQWERAACVHVWHSSVHVWHSYWQNTGCTSRQKREAVGTRCMCVLVVWRLARPRTCTC